MISLKTGNIVREADLFTPPEHASDFPIKIQCHPSTDIVQVFTKHGFIHTYDYTANLCIDMIRVIEDNAILYFNCSLFEEIMLTRSGKIHLIRLNAGNAVTHLKNLGRLDLAIKIATQTKNSCDTTIYSEYIISLLASKNINSAVDIFHEKSKELRLDGLSHKVMKGIKDTDLIADFYLMISQKDQLMTDEVNLIEKYCRFNESNIELFENALRLNNVQILVI